MFQTRAGLPPFSRERLIVAMAACGLMLFAGGSRYVAAAETAQVDPVQVKAAFIINFLRFVDWPAERVPPADMPYVVAVLNDPSFQSAVEAAASEQAIDGRRIAVQGVSSADEASEAHVVFLGAPEERRIGAVVQRLRAWHVLTVGDTPGFGQSGVMLNLFVANQRVQFEANTAAASQAGVRLRSALLRLARIVG